MICLLLFWFIGIWLYLTWCYFIDPCCMRSILRLDLQLNRASCCCCLSGLLLLLLLPVHFRTLITTTKRSTRLRGGNYPAEQQAQFPASWLY